eukprot:CAMPEP_0174293180 /NCGR_PEP_ID=MMETSP0809-20121228/37747_1 /TAXON_ID=73025 ORGANISM="Eutreptiella gymnastica-like, Strain CCMP1594" /NCGR_SAMPLE_ID=MMETSP0809 /ASSEMBLY_ACC=CAM_ASM_000658 /LENGTH=102 /DNA_ID=CAMNT_0015393775 /DNA_START=66 /DNA_END=371 /DNA_ORIENTATION=+
MATLTISQAAASAFDSAGSLTPQSPQSPSAREPVYGGKVLHLQEQVQALQHELQIKEREKRALEQRVHRLETALRCQVDQHKEAVSVLEGVLHEDDAPASPW